MKCSGGLNISLDGRPSGRVEVLEEPKVLHLPLHSRRFEFGQLCVQAGARVQPGQILARDDSNYGVPLLAPRAGTVRLDLAAEHISLEDLAHASEEPFNPAEDAPHAPKARDSSEFKRQKLLTLGAWQWVCDAHTGRLADPSGTPRAVIVSTIRLEPYATRGDVQLHKRLLSFTHGLEHIQSLLDYQPIYLVLPDIDSQFARQVRQVLRGYAWVKMVEVPLRYGCEDFNVLSRGLGLKRQAEAPVWSLQTEGVLAIDRALTLSLPCTVRIISLGGPAVESPVHLKTMPGYPLVDLLAGRLSRQDNVRVINGGVLTGDQMHPEQLGIDAECTGLTVLAEAEDRQFLGWLHPGWDRRSYSRCFVGTLARRRGERLTTALCGEGRPCISCNYCEEVCPAGIMPHVIHKYLYQDLLEEAESAGVGLCVECGLCSYVCPSKLELRQQFVEGKQTVLAELHAEEAQV